MTDRPKILHVEDDNDIAEIARLALVVVGGLEVVQCVSGAEAIEKFAGVAPDLLLLDVMMPGMDGRKTLANIRALPGGETVPVIFVTARAQKSEVEELLKLGALDVIVKPFDPMALANQILDIYRKSQPTR